MKQSTRNIPGRLVDQGLIKHKCNIPARNKCWTMDILDGAHL